MIASKPGVVECEGTALERLIGAHLSGMSSESAIVKPSASDWIQAASSMRDALRLEDRYTYEHSERTWILVEKLDSELGLFARYSKESIRMGCLLHDIGKLAIPNSVLLKPGKLTPEEFEVIKTHTMVAYDVLSQACQDEIVLNLVRHHHERVDGSGYPDGIRGREIPDYVNALAVCDCFDALTSDRPYRRALPIEEALAILRDDAARGVLDSAVVDALHRVFGA